MLMLYINIHFSPTICTFRFIFEFIVYILLVPYFLLSCILTFQLVISFIIRLNIYFLHIYILVYSHTEKKF